MSGSNTIPPIPLRFEGAENVQRTIDAIVARVGQLENAGKGAAASMGTLRTQAEQTGGAFRNTGQIIGQAGYQVQDFAVQVASGQSALTAFVQQGSQLAGIFGPGGAIAGAALAIGGIAAQLLFMGETAEQANKRIGDGFRANQRAGEDLTRVIQALSDELLTASQRAANLANNQRQILIGEGQGHMMRLENERTAAVEQFSTAERDLARIARDEARFRSMGPGFESELRDVQGRRFSAEAQRIAAQRTMDEATRRIAELRGLVDRAEMIRNGPDEYSYPPAPEQNRRGGSSTRRDPNQFGPLDGSPQSLMTLERGRIASLEAAERDAAQRERVQERSLDRQEDANRRVTDSIISYGSERFADFFDENNAGWAGMWETMERTARSTLARIAAELAFRPVVEPIVSSLGLGGLGSGNGGLSGLFGGTTSGGTVGGASSGGLGTLSSGGGLFSQIGGYISNPIWQPGAGWFASSASGTTAGLEALGAGVYGPAVPGGGGILGNIGGVSAGTYAAGIGGGYMAGSMLGNYLAGNSAARQQNAQIGAGGGAMAGALAGAAIGGPAAPVTAIIGGIVGGLAGGAGGGLLGPGKGFSGGDVGVAVDANGFLTLGKVGGKNWDGTAARNQTSAQLDQINQMLRASGVTIQGMGTGTLGYQGYGGSTRSFGPTEIWGSVRGGLTTSNSTLSAALSQGWMQSFEDLSVIAPYAAQNDNLTRALGSGGIRSRDDFNSASQWITGVYEPMLKAASITNQWQEALNQQNAAYDAAIAKARELGLAESGLTSARDKAAAEVERARNTSVHGALESLRIDELTAAGDLRGAEGVRFNLETGTRVAQFADFLKSNGIMEGDALYQSSTARLNALIETQRQGIFARWAAEDAAPAGRTSSLMEELLYGSASGMSGAGRYAAGKGVLDTYRRAGDLEGYTAAASRFLPSAREYLGTSERYGGLVSEIRGAISALGGDPNGLLQDAQYRTADGVEMTVRRLDVTNDELRQMRAGIENLAARVEALARRAA